MTDLTLDEALKKIAVLEEANAKLQYRVNHLVRCAKENTKDTTATRPACNAFNSKPLVLSKDSAFSNRLSLRTLLESKFGGVAFAGQTVTVGGWVQNIRCNKKLGFIELNDGSTALSLQLVGDAKLKDWPVLSSLTRGSAALFTGVIVKSPKPAQPIEMQVATVELLGACDAETYGLTKPFHSFDHLRTIAHMRARTPPLASVLRIRNALAFATHTFYQEQGFVYFHAPIITASDCEGAGEMFQVSTLLDSEHGSEKASLKKQTYKGDFFERPAFLTVSGQLSAETAACALTKVYTFGPTFRAENSNTSRHLAEFWMIEPEVSFCDVNGAMDLAEEYVRHSIGYVLRECSNDLKTLESMSQTFENWKTVDGFVDSLKKLQTTAFGRLTYTDAITKLEEAVAGGHQFENPVEWGMDLPTEMERYLAEVVYKGPVFVYNYPKDIKAFYMRMNDDGKTVAAFDLLVPGVGELIGGSQREEREDALLKRLDELKLDKEAYWWYLDLRKFGTVPHSGFGLGFERLVMLSTGMRNIRDVIPYPRYPGAAEF